jgi:hypothetical protein
MTRSLKRLVPVLLALAPMLLSVTPVSATRIGVGELRYSYPITDDTDVAVTYGNTDTVTSAALRLEFWAFRAAYAGGSLEGFKLFQAEVEPLDPGQSTTRHFSPRGQVLSWPPDNAGYLTIIVTEFDGGPANGGYAPRTYCGGNAYFTDIGPRPPTPKYFTPVKGLWWNPTESGSGYMLDLRHGVMVVTVYSYTATGEPQWYIASGPLTNGGREFTRPLEKYRGGQCISCPYQQPSPSGTDGNVSIRFDSPTSAVMTLPGGRVTRIQPQDF